MKGPGRVLEIGSSSGALLDVFKDKEWETWGVEPSQNAEHASLKGHKITRSFFEKAKLPKKYFQLVVLNHTLEHMENPLQVLTKIKKHLKKGGIVLIDVPNYGSLSSLILGKCWPFLLPQEHLWQFTPKSLARLLKKAGFKVVCHKSRSGIFEFESPMSGLALELRERKKAFLKDFLGAPLAFIATLLNMGSSFSIIGIL
jgi:SAM-dependent methyltransferase